MARTAKRESEEAAEVKTPDTVNEFKAGQAVFAINWGFAWDRFKDDADSQVTARAALWGLEGDPEGPTDPDLAITVAHAPLARLLFAAEPVVELAALVDEGAIELDGDRAALEAFLATLDAFTLMFPIVTP